MWSLSEACYYLGLQGTEDPRMREWLQLFGEHLSEFAKASEGEESFVTEDDMEALFFIRDEIERQTPVEKINEMLATGQHLTIKGTAQGEVLEQELLESSPEEALSETPVLLMEGPAEEQPEESLEELLSGAPVSEQQLVEAPPEEALSETSVLPMEGPAEEQPEESLEKLLSEASVSETREQAPLAETVVPEAETSSAATEELTRDLGAESVAPEELGWLGEELRTLRGELEAIRQLLDEQKQLRVQRDDALEDKGRLLLQIGYLQAKLEQALGLTVISSTPLEETPTPGEALEVSPPDTTTEGITPEGEAAMPMAEETVAVAEEQEQGEEEASRPEEELDPIARLRKKIVQAQEEQGKEAKRKRGPWPFGRKTS